MRRTIDTFRTFAEAVAGALMAAMFVTFIVQVTIRYTARADWIAEAVPLLQPSNFGWTLEFCLALWVWLVFWGNAFVVRNQEHVSFDILYLAVAPGMRRAFFIAGGLAISVGLLLSIEPTWDRLAVLRLKKTATLSALFGDWIRMRDIYAIYLLFLFVVALRYAAGVWRAFRHGVDELDLSDGERVDA
ncbi:C4-dicarboxylate ABC transporter permease [Mesorhizobium sp. L-8-10]|uniref:TRAP transporter small permease n=1 Tax=unclassified Mesorhizobium TaxID=325217 RepID=UPI0019376628|nr:MULTISPECIES: TRAP transporter small permease subunit [unclassified Mesorhizobium]BCH25658.1 C4-dicarboxylate ABC transporter permease [Mesorhizobium sp. L-8-3]BCH33653.1 C4-dicarboxylate ABC transporter permease [Mesorhizobium sp. L-8-10]